MKALFYVKSRPRPKINRVSSCIALIRAFKLFGVCDFLLCFFVSSSSFSSLSFSFLSFFLFLFFFA